MDRILVGMDASAAAADALEWAAAVGEAVDAKVFAVNALQSPYAEVSPADRDRLVAEREAALDGWIAAATRDPSVEAMVRNGDPRQVLLSEADAHGADVVVLGRTGAGGGPGFLHLGSVVEYAAHHSSIPLAVIPPGRRRPPERVLVGVDGSSESLAAVTWVASLAPIGPQVAAVQVVEPYVEWTPPTSPKNWRRDVERDLERWTSPLTEAGLSVTPIAQRDFHPADGLLGLAAARNADLVVVGTRGVGGFKGLRAGGVALKILHRAGLPLVLVPAG